MQNMILKNGRIINPADNIDDILDINIEDGIIIDIAKNIQGENFIDCSNKIISPGFIDMHCHLREPGFEYKETIKTGIESAINGGYVGICPMANTNPVVDNKDSLKYIVEKAEQVGSPILFPICAITKGLEGKELVDIRELKNSGAIAFSDDGKPLENLKLYKQALLSGELVISHAEDSKLLTDPISEAVSVARELEVLRAVGGKLHFAHISTKRAIELIRQAKKEGLNVTCETAPHYFSFTNADVTTNGRFKMNPPLRSQNDFDAVIKGLIDGTIDCIATDHAPHSLEEKIRAFEDSPFGIVGFETALGACITNLVNKKHLNIVQIIEKLSINPAKILGLKEYGNIKIGQKANLTIIDPNIEWKVEENNFKSKCKISPFDGMTLRGKAVSVIANGKYYSNIQETGEHYENN